MSPASPETLGRGPEVSAVRYESPPHAASLRRPLQVLAVRYDS